MRKLIIWPIALIALSGLAACDPATYRPQVAAAVAQGPSGIKAACGTVRRWPQAWRNRLADELEKLGPGHWAWILFEDAQDARAAVLTCRGELKRRR